MPTWSKRCPRVEAGRNWESFCGQPGKMVAWISGGEREMSFFKYFSDKTDRHDWLIQCGESAWGWLRKWPSILSYFLYLSPLQNDLLAPPLRRWSLSLQPLYWAWTCDMLRPLTEEEATPNQFQGRVSKSLEAFFLELSLRAPTPLGKHTEISLLEYGRQMEKGPSQPTIPTEGILDQPNPSWSPTWPHTCGPTSRKQPSPAKICTIAQTTCRPMS